MTVLIVRYAVTDTAVPEVETGIRGVLSAIERQQPAGLRGYAMCRRADGAEFLGLLQLDTGAPNPLPTIPAAREFQARLGGWVIGAPPRPEPFEVVGSYGLLADRA